MIIGITGKSGSGKNHFATQMIKLNKNIVHVDIDTIGHDVITFPEVKIKLREAFGNEVFSGNVVDRKVLGDLVFNCRHHHDKLTEITWECMQNVIDKIIYDSPFCDIIFNWILLPHTKYFKMCDVTYLVIRDNDKRVASILERDNISIEKLALRDKNSIEYSEDEFDFIIHNKR